MKIIKINNLQTKLNPNNKPLIAIWGFFDGWHKGHQALLQQLKSQAKNLTYETLVISFDVKPQAMLMNQDIPILFDNKAKQDFLIANQIDNYWELKFTKELANNSAQVFIAWLLKNQVRAVVVSSAIRFGSKGQGNIDTLKDSELQVFICREINDTKMKISSSYIKSLLINKDIKTANQCLNNVPYTISGQVVHGIKEGRTLGYRTANLALTTNYTIPGLGIYITLTKVKNQWYKSLTIIIMRNNQPLVETYILDFNQDIYGEIIEVRFLDFLRDNIAYTTREVLIRQIEDDVKAALKYFKSYKE